MKKNNQRSLENFLVGKRGVTTLYTTAGNNPRQIAGQASGNLADGQFAFLNAFPGSSYMQTVASGITAATTPILQIIQGTENTATPWAQPKGPLSTIVFEKSGYINSSRRVTVTKQPYKIGRESCTVIGKPTASSTGKINTLNNTEYSIRINFKGKAVEEFYSNQQALSFSASVLTPDFTALGTTERIGWIVENMVTQINRNSDVIQYSQTKKGQYPVLALAISTAVSGTVINTITTSTFIPVANTTTGVKGVRLTKEQLASLNEAVVAAGFALTNSIVAVDLSLAGTRNLEGIILLGAKANEAYLDRRIDLTITHRAFLTAGFAASVYDQTLVQATNGQGEGKILNQIYENTHGQRKYHQLHNMNPYIKYPSPVVTDETYTVYTIEHINAHQTDISSYNEDPAKEILLFPTTTKGAENGSVPAIETAFETLMNTWLNSFGSPSIFQ